MERAEFALVRDSVEITDSALSKQCALLESIGYVEVTKGRVGRRPRTWLALTPPGAKPCPATWPHCAQSPTCPRHRPSGTEPAANSGASATRTTAFDARVGLAFASRTNAELAAVTTDIAARQIADQPPGNPARAQGRPPMSHAAKGRRCVVIALAMMTVATFAPGGPALLLFAPLCLTALMAAAAQILASKHEKRSRGQLAGPSI